MKLLKEEILKIKSIMGLVFEEVSKGVMPEPPKLISKELTNWVKDSDGDLNNGNGYKKEVVGKTTTVYDGNFKNEVFQSGYIYTYREDFTYVTQTDNPITKKDNRLNKDLKTCFV